MGQILQDAGVFAYPLGLCSLLAMFIIIERLVALRASAVIPRQWQEAFLRGELPTAGDSNSVAGRIVAFFHDPQTDAAQLKAFAQLQVTRMERGLFVLDVVISAAPLIGLLGTVTGLIQVFSQIDPQTGVPEMANFVEGVALALTTTMMGLVIAIPALAFNGYLQRKIDHYAAQLGVGVERLLAAKRYPNVRGK